MPTALRPPSMLSPRRMPQAQAAPDIRPAEPSSGVAVKLTFLGAATTVTGSQFLLTTDRAHVLIDGGLFQGPPQEAELNREPLAYDTGAIDAILVTHAHLD